MFDLEAIEKRYAAGAPAKEDLGDLIAEVKRLSDPDPFNGPVKDRAAESHPGETDPPLADKFTGKPIDTTEYE